MILKKNTFSGFKNVSVLLGLFLLVGCTSIPTMVPDMAMQQAHQVKLNSINGELSAKQSQAILAKLQKNGDDTNIFDKHLALESQIVGSPLMVGNKVELLIDGPTTYAAMFAAIESAKDHINLETFIIENDEIGQHFARLLIAKQASGVQVNLIYDSVGSISTPTAFFDELKASGINVLEYNPINPLVSRKGWQVNQRDHRKLLIVDGKIAFVGGINISSVYSSGSFGKSKRTTKDQPWRDTHLRMEGPVVGEFQKLFMATWSVQKGETLAAKNYFPDTPIKGNEVVRAIGSSPDEPYSQIYSTLISAINSAETQVFITNAYFVPDPKLLAALKEAVQRGVDVRLLLPGKTDSMLVLYASRSYYDELLSANVKIYERQDALLHAKTAMIDGVWSTIGSTNLDWRSFINNQEINAVILGQSFGAQMQTLFEKDLEASQLITLESWRSRSLAARIKERAARLWARFL
ncbi:MAG: cardiolipin synthase [Methylotenera sp.]|uniref:cardiolipin synthase n=1 Tax=Methylotenera sp. TaxID=2051956 RepID=UPI00248826E3|nr:cardiolipin synthase [Methylotenera sp.]MDI1308055.1 cardiolipin synthase [Methylotenera sp.]